MPAKTGLRAALEDLKTLATDLTTIEVRTYTGTINAVLDANGAIDPAKLKAADSAVRLVALTQVDFDYDTVNFRETPPGTPTAESLNENLTKVHEAAVESAIKGRAAMLKMFSDVILG